MKILVTGGGGFKGSHLVELLLKEGHEVTVLNTLSELSKRNLSGVMDSINMVWGSVTDKEIVDKTVRGHDVVMHLAGRINVDESLEDPVAFFHANILGTYNVLEATRKNGNRLIFASTCEVYGDGHDLNNEEALSEHSELRANSPYAASKAAADRIAYSYFKSFDIDLTIVRPFNIFGERQKSGQFGALIPIIVSRAIKGEDLTIFGDGSAERDYSHVSDVVGGYNMILNSDNMKGKVMNLASGESTSVKDIVEYIAKKFDAKIVNKPERPGEVKRFPADVSFAKSLGYSPKISIWEGIDRYVEWAKAEAAKS